MLQINTNDEYLDGLYVEIWFYFLTFIFIFYHKLSFKLNKKIILVIEGDFFGEQIKARDSCLGTTQGGERSTKICSLYKYQNNRYLSRILILRS